MKKICIVLALLFVASTTLLEAEEKGGLCPRTGVVGPLDSCLQCHTTPSFKLKERSDDEGYIYPLKNMQLDFKGGVPVSGTIVLETIDSKSVAIFFDYLAMHNVKRAIVEIHSPGGALVEAWKIVGLFKAWQTKGGVVETRTYGFAASAGFLVFVSGTKGERYVAPQAELMWHELLLIQFGIKISSPSNTEEESRVLRHLQDTANSWLAEVSNLKKEEIDDLVKKREFWMNGVEAVKYGFADHLIGK